MIHNNFPILSNGNESTDYDHSSGVEGLILWIPKVLVVNKRTNPTDDALAVYVTLDDGCVVIETEKRNINLVLTLDELRAIVRLFDVPSDE